MKYKSLVILFIIILSTITLQGCVDQNPKSILVSAHLNTLGFKSNELPNNVIKQNETYNNTQISVEFSSNMTVTFLETYRVEYVTNDSDILFTLDMKKLNSTDIASNIFELEKYDLTYHNPDYETYSIDEIGDDSIVVNSRDLYIVLFRKYNVLSTMHAIINIDFTIQEFIEMANIVVNHIESSL